ncbi:voltage-gated potassium channel KCNC4-like [Babylonia areolata]|uniref:voltage-gated potassium channel KCNC4-like n=1 Tax=Babylonia areolata TaxID=304850 RepID=UPI003FD4AAD9
MRRVQKSPDRRTDRMRCGRRGDFESAIRPYKGCGITRKSLQRLFDLAIAHGTSKISINVNGTVFLLTRGTCIRIPTLRSMLTKGPHRWRKSILGVRPNLHGLNERQLGTIEFTFEKNTEVFAAVVDFVQNNELHAPQAVCPTVIARDLMFWGFDVNYLEPCCFAKVVHFLYHQESLGEFHGFLETKTKLDESDEHNYMDLQQKTCFQQLQHTMVIILERPFQTTASRIYFFITVISIVGAFVTASAETMEQMNFAHQFRNANYTDVSENVFLLFHSIDLFCIGFQCLDIVLRVLFYPTPIRFLCDPINVTDGVAAVAAAMKLITPVVFHCDVIWHLEECSGELVPYLYVIYSLQLLRILRILRPMSQVMQFRLLYYTLKTSMGELLLVFLLLLLLAMISSCMIYYLGSKKSIANIPDAMWFSLITLTTVGYGDFVPDDVSKGMT